MVTAHLINHTHWDREWYFTTMDALVLSEQLFTEVLDELDKNNDANFTLDGQTSIVDEYVEIHPEALQRIKKLVNEGRLFIGPWYTQTDALIPDSESIIRNLVIGINDSNKKYGKPMMVGYLPDTFGFNAQLPTLLNQVGIDSLLFWRGTNFDRQTDSVYFNWHGLGNKKVIAIDFPFGYFSGQITPESKEHMEQFVKERYDKIANFEADHGDHEDVMMPSGIDQMNIIKDITGTVKLLNQYSKYHTVIDTYPGFVKLMRKKQETLPNYSGELRLPTYSRVHRTIGSVRHEIKHQNFLLEQKILKRVEPLAVIGNKVGISIGNGLLIKLWKKLLECQAHDTLGGSISDNVAVDIMHRFKEANEIADGIENMIKKKIADYLHLNSDQVLVFNTSPYEFKGHKEVSIVANSKNITIDGMKNTVIDHYSYFPTRHHIQTMTSKGKEFIDEPEYFQLFIDGEVELPGLGYKVLNIHNTDKKLPEPIIDDSESFTQIHSNGKTLEFKNGHINLIVGDKTVNNVLELVDSGNDGDTYDYSPLDGDEEQVLPLYKATIKHVGKQDSLELTGAARLPKSLKDRESTMPDYGSLTYKLSMKFDETGMIKAHLELNNDILSHRTRLKFNPDLKTDVAYANIQAGYVETRNEPIPDDWMKKYDEKPVNIYNFDKTVTIRDKNSYLTFLSAGENEYEYVNNTLYITLLATVSQLGKPDIAWRPGRASGDTTNQGHVMMPTPLAEEQGLNEFDFAFEFKDQKFDQERNNRLIHLWLDQSVSYQSQQLNLFINRLDNKIWTTEDQPIIPDSLSILELSRKVNVAALYPSYSDERSLIIRIQNITDSKLNIPSELMSQGSIVDALEKPLENDGSIGAYDLISIKIPYLK